MIKFYEVLERPGFFGKRRAEKEAIYNESYPGWIEGWEIPLHIGYATVKVVLTFQEAVLLYDEAYYIHLRACPAILSYVKEFGECYDSDESNILCGLEHDSNAIPRHIQDVSVRRALLRLGEWFQGPSIKLLHIRGPETNGHILMPGIVPFHNSSLISKEECMNMPNWVRPGSVEYFWQKNKVIIIPRGN